MVTVAPYYPGRAGDPRCAVLRRRPRRRGWSAPSGKMSLQAARVRRRRRDLSWIFGDEIPAGSVGTPVDVSTNRPFTPQKMGCPSTVLGLLITQINISGTNLLANSLGPDRAAERGQRRSRRCCGRRSTPRPASNSSSPTPRAARWFLRRFLRYAGSPLKAGPVLVAIDVGDGFAPAERAWFIKSAIEGFALGCLPAFERWGLPPLYQSGVRFRLPARAWLGRRAHADATRHVQRWLGRLRSASHLVAL
jgi:hypothetical protein